ncbi:PA-phosphatase [Brevundimonas sp. M20]|uniref:PA-phosphatase n=1 Tax=Brevundimonas sp. M20 TaxID=2591463 RepID=UPI00114796E9|nr:PA-phosphatase [Brevundimonas sp. M20]QDH74568.1 PA-phosphatase [Brevundimonas sp. M20]
MDRRLIRVSALSALILLTGACTNTMTRAAPVGLPSAGYLDDADLLTFAGGFTPSPQPLEWVEGPPGRGPGSDRWWLAISQAEIRAPEAAQHFDCILGTRLNQHPRPALTRLMNRLLVDTDSVTRRLATAYPRPRPISVDPSLQPCQRITDEMRDSPSWPAAAAVAGAAYSEMFATLVPDQQSRLRGMGRVIGQSRMVCRMNWHSDVADGERIGRALYARASAEPGFAEDLEAARAEVAAARAEGLANPSCAAEQWALRERLPPPLN